MPSFHYLNNTLHCEDVNLDELAKEVGTPAYVYSATTILENYRRFDRVFASLDRMICYATKANSNLAVLRLLAKEGAGFDVVSGGELFKVLKAGGSANKCTFAGVGKMAHEIQYALEQGIFCFNVESEGELKLINDVAGKLGVIAPIALRVNPDVDVATHHYISTGKSKNKFGIGLDRAESVYEHAARMPHLKIRGVQTHIGSQILEAAPFAEALQKLTSLILTLKKKYGLEFFSLGGGLGIDYSDILKNSSSIWSAENFKPASKLAEADEGQEVDGAQELSVHEVLDAPSTVATKPFAASVECESRLEAYAAKVLQPLKALGLKILFEPGRFIVGNAGVLLSTALYQKTTPTKKFLILDAGMNDLIRPALYQGYHEIIPLKEKLDRSNEKVDVVGPVCESGDFFAQDRMMLHIEPGERVAVMSVGAYGMTMASTYNARPLPPEVLIEGKNATVVRRRQTWEDLIDHEMIDEKLRG